jgi:hypothetical protein
MIDRCAGGFGTEDFASADPWKKLAGPVGRGVFVGWPGLRMNGADGSFEVVSSKEDAELCSNSRRHSFKMAGTIKIVHGSTIVVIGATFIAFFSSVLEVELIEDELLFEVVSV